MGELFCLGDEMITNTKLTIDDDGTFRLKNTVNIQSSLDLARQCRENNTNGWFGDKNGECRMLGYIPEEEFVINPWLIEAKRAKFAGDLGKYNYYMTKFFELFPALAANKESRYWNGHRAVLL